ncbi:ABC transporter permease subunit [Terrilactibacillus sp. S3-3]|nr:ABC transporter permease subunit [Terrilactibacillus sp. S3-3]
MRSTENNPFIPLVKHEFKRRRDAKRHRMMNKQWRRFYLFFLFIAALIVTTFFSLSYRIHLTAIWNFDWVIPWIIFVLSVGVVKREWANETVGWWLSLPYSRRLLIIAKFWAMVGRGILIAVSAYLLIAIFGGYATLVSRLNIKRLPGLHSKRELLSGDLGRFDPAGSKHRDDVQRHRSNKMAAVLMDFWRGVRFIMGDQQF